MPKCLVEIKITAKGSQGSGKSIAIRELIAAIKTIKSVEHVSFKSQDDPFPQLEKAEASFYFDIDIYRP